MPDPPAFAPTTIVTHPSLDRLLADVGAPVRRVVFARGVEAVRDANGGWQQPPAFPGAAPPAVAALAALGLRPVEPPPGGAPGGSLGGAAPPSHDPVAVSARHGLAPLLLVTSGALGTETTHLVSTAGALGWRPAIDRLYDDATLARHALRLRFVLDALEHHAGRAAESYVACAAAARRTAALFGTGELTTLAGQTALFVELDALLRAVQRSYVGAARLLAAGFAPRRGPHARAHPTAHDADLRRTPFDALVLGARGAPVELRETLLAAWETNGARTGAYRRALRAHDVAELGHAPVQLARLEADVWAVSVAVALGAGPQRGRGATALPRRQDALDRAWELATDAARVVSLVVFALSED